MPIDLPHVIVSSAAPRAGKTVVADLIALKAIVTRTHMAALAAEVPIVDSAVTASTLSMFLGENVIDVAAFYKGKPGVEIGRDYWRPYRATLLKLPCLIEIDARLWPSFVDHVDGEWFDIDRRPVVVVMVVRDGSEIELQAETLDRLRERLAPTPTRVIYLLNNRGTEDPEPAGAEPVVRLPWCRSEIFPPYRDLQISLEELSSRTPEQLTREVEISLERASEAKVAVSAWLRQANNVIEAVIARGQ